MKKKERNLPVHEQNVPLELPNEAYIEENPYYLRVSRHMRFAGLLCAVALVLFVVAMAAARSDDITVSNFKYLLRDINKSSASENAFSGVSYSAEPIQRFAVYRGELAYITGGTVKLFTATGGTGLTAEHSYENPVAVASEKYLLIYDVGSYEYALYNSFSQLYRETLEYPVTAADVADCGSFIIATAGREHHGTALLYNDDLELIARYRKSDHITDVAVSEDGSRAAITTVSVSEGDFVSKMIIYEPGLDSEAASDTINGDYPIALEYNGSGFTVFGVDGVYFYDANGSRLGSYTATDGELDMFASGAGYAALVLRRNAVGSENRVVVLDVRGEVCYSAVIGEKLTDISVSSRGELFLLTSSHAVMIDIEAGTEKTKITGSSPLCIIATGDQTALICTPSSAETIDFKQLAALTD